MAGLRFELKISGQAAEFKFDAARLAESHPGLKELRSKMIERANGDSGRVDFELALRFFDALHRFGEGYVQEMSATLGRIFEARNDLADVFAKAAKGESISPEAVKAKFDQLARDMAQLKSPEKKLTETPAVELPPKEKAVDAAGEAAKEPPKETIVDPAHPLSEAEIDAMLDGIEDREGVVPRVEKGKIDGRTVPKAPRDPERRARWFNRRANKLDLFDLVRRAGESFRQAFARVLKVLGTRISDHPDVLRVWNEARAKVLKGRPLESITRDEMLGHGEFKGKSMYDKVRDQFWADMRKPENAAAKKVFEDAGFIFGDEPAPVLETTNPNINKGDIKASLDHAAEKAQGENWRRAIDGDNLVFEFADPNTFREIWQVRHKARARLQ